MTPEGPRRDRVFTAALVTFGVGVVAYVVVLLAILGGVR